MRPEVKNITNVYVFLPPLSFILTDLSGNISFLQQVQMFMSVGCIWLISIHVFYFRQRRSANSSIPETVLPKEDHSHRVWAACGITLVYLALPLPFSVDVVFRGSLLQNMLLAYQAILTKSYPSFCFEEFLITQRKNSKQTHHLKKSNETIKHVIKVDVGIYPSIVLSDAFCSIWH